MLAASHELTHLAPAAARTLLQRGLRLNGESVELWREYARMELGYVERLRRRWDKLGARSRADPDPDADTHAMDEADEGEAARRLVLEGAIVREVISNAVKGVCFVAKGPGGVDKGRRTLPRWRSSLSHPGEAFIILVTD